MARQLAANDGGMRLERAFLRCAGCTLSRSHAFRLLAVLGGLLVLALIGAQRADAATTRAQAAKTALKTLKVQKGKAPVVVFQMLQPLPRNAKITEIGPAKYAATRKVKPTLLHTTSRSTRVWMFWADTNPYGQYQHAGRLVLVSVNTGRVLLNKPTRYAPMVNGKLPPFLGNSRRYEAKTWRVFYRPWQQSAKVVPSARSGVQADPSLRADLAAALGAQNTCVVIAGARGGGVPGEVAARSATFVEWYFRALAKLDGGIGVWRYAPASTTTFADYLEEVASEQPCRNMLLYIAGQAAATGEPLVMLDATKVQEIRAKQILKLLRAHRSMQVSLVLDASQSSRFYRVIKNEPNLAAYLAPRGTKNVAFGFLPEVKVGKKVVKNAANPRRIQEFTNDLLYGLNVFTTSPSEVAHAIASTAGDSGSVAAWMLGRGDRIKTGSGMADRTGSATDEVHERRPSSPPPPVVIPNTAPVATSLTIATNEDTPVALPLAATDAQSDAFTFEIVTQPAHGTVTLGGAAPAIYAPAANYHGPDTLTYRAVDVRGAIGDPATVTLTVTPVEDGPQLTLDAFATYTEGDPDLVLAPTADIVDVEAPPRPIASATVSIGSGYVPGEDVLHFVDTADITSTFDAPSGTLTLMGSATSADYAAALRTITYENTAGASLTEGPRTITTVLVSDTGATGTAMLTLAVIAYNDPPTSADTTISVTEDTPQPFTISGTDLDGDAIDLVIVTPPANGQISGTGLTRTYTPNLDFSGSDTFTFRVQDARGATSVALHTATITVTAVNDAPLVTIGGSLAYTEGDAAAAISVDATVADVDTLTLSGAVVTVTGCVSPEDVLAFADTASITGTWTPGTCTMSLTGAASVADYQAALRTVTYRNTSENPSTAARTISVTATDSVGATSIAATKPLTIVAQNDAPLLTASAGSTAYTERSAAVAVDPALDVVDVDDTTLSTATVTITSGRATGDVLAVATQNGISGTYNATTGALTLSGSSSVANYQTALRSVTFANATSTTPGASRTIEFVARDAADWSAATIKTLAITQIDDLPVVTTSAGTTAYTELAPAVVVDSGITVTDGDSSSMASATVTISSGRVAGDVLGFVDQNGISGSFAPGTGVLTLTGSASTALYQAALRTIEFSSTSTSPGATKVVTFTVNDGSGTSLGATRSIAITQLNDAPVVTASVGATAYTEQAAAVAIDTTLTVSDTDDTDLVGATVTIATGRTSGDALGFTTQNGISGTYNGTTGVLTLTGTSSVANYQTALRTVTFASTNQAPGTARVIAFRAIDAAGTSAPSTKDITLTLVNDAPAVSTSAGSTAYTEQAAPVVVDSSVLVTDVDSVTLASATVTVGGRQSGDQLTFVNQNGINGIYNGVTGVLSLTGTATLAQYETALRSITFSSTNQAPTATRTISFVVNDGTLSSPAATPKSIAISLVNDAPTVAASGGSTAYTEDGAAAAVDAGITVADADSTNLTGATVTISVGRQNGDLLSFTTQNGISSSFAPGTGVLTLSGTSTVANYQTALRSITFSTSHNNPTSARTVSFVVTDGTLSSAATGHTKNIAITPTNDAPVITTTVAALAYTENAGAVVADNALTVADDDNATLQGATVSISANYAAGEDSLGWTDADLGDGITQNVGGSSAQTIALQGAGTIAAYQAALRLVTYTNSSETPSATPRTLAFTATDGALTSAAANRTVNVTPVDDPPVAVNDTFTAARDAAAVAVPVMANDTDVDGGPMSIASVGTTPNGTVVRTGGGTGLTYQPNPGYCNDGSPLDTFTYTLNGGSVGTVSVTITCAVNQAPTAADFTLSGNSSAVGNTPLVYDGPDDGAPSVTTARKVVVGGLLGHTSDPDVGDTRTIVPVSNVTTTDGGRVTIQADGDFVFTPKATTTCADAQDTFDYTVIDAGGLTDVGTATVEIRGCVWYVDNTASAGGAGDAVTPFDTLAAATSHAGLVANSAISVAKGSGVALNSGTVNVPAGVSLIGEGSDLVVDPDGAGSTYAPATLKAANPTGFPLLAASNVAVVTPNANSTIAGVQIDPTGNGSGINATGTSKSGIAIRDVRIIDTDLDASSSNQALVTGTNTTGLSIANLTVDTQGVGVVLAGGSVTFEPTGTISLKTRDQLAISQSGATVLAGEIDEITVTAGSAGTMGFNTGSASGAIVLGTTKLDLTMAGGYTAALSLAGANTTYTIPSSATATINAAGPSLNIGAIASASNLHLDTITTPSSLGGGIAWAPGSTSTATLTVDSGSLFTATTPVIISSGTGNVDLAGVALEDGGNSLAASIATRSAGTVRLGRITDGSDNGGGVTIAALTGTAAVEFTDSVAITTNAAGIALTSAAGTSSVTFASTVQSSVSSTNAAISLLAVGAGTSVTFNGNVTASTSAGGLAVTQATTGGTITYNGTLSATSTSSAIALSLGNSTSGTMNFNGAVTASNSSTGAAISHTGASGGLAVNYVGGLNASSQTGAAMTLGTMVLTVTGSANTLSATTGGAFRTASTSFGASGVTFRSINTTGGTQGIVMNTVAAGGGAFEVTGNGGTCTSPASCTGGAIQNATTAGMTLTNVQVPVRLNRMSINDGTGDGIVSATRLDSLSISDSRFVGNGDGAGDNGLEVIGSTGTNSIANTSFVGNFTSNVSITQSNTIATTWTITGSTFAGANGTNVALSAGTGAFQSNFTFTGNTLSGDGTAPVANTNSILVATPNSALNKTNIANNTIKGATGSAISVTSASATTTMLSEIAINNNTIGDGTAGSGSATGRGISVDYGGPGRMRVLVTNNTIRNFSTNGMDFYGHNAAAAGRFDITATGNTVANPDQPTGSSAGIHVRAGVTGTDLFTTCFDVGGAGALGNSFTGSGGSGSRDFSVTRTNSPVLQAAGWDGVTPFDTYLSGRNIGAPSVIAGPWPQLATSSLPASCALPTLP